MTRVGLYHLSDAQLELMSAMAQQPDLEVVAAVHPDVEAAVYKIAQVLEVPTGTTAALLRDQRAEVVVIPDDGDGLRDELAAAGGEPFEILSTRQAAARWGLLEDLSGPAETSSGDGQPLDDDGRRAVGAGAVPRDRAPSAGPDLDVMLRDALDAMTEAEGDLAARLGELAAAWAKLTDARAAALFVDDREHGVDEQWVVAGPRAADVRGADAILLAALEGVPQVYVKHGSASGEPSRAVGAFPLEVVRGGIWLLDFRLPAHGAEARMQSLRRAARRLGRLLALEGRVSRLARDRDAALRFADVTDSMAQATDRDQVLEALVGAVRSEVGAELVILRLESEREPRIYDADLPPALRAARVMLVAAEDELARGARVSLRTRQQPAMLVGERVVGGLSSPLRRGNEVLGTVSVFSSQTRGEGALYGDHERLVLERLALHAAGSLALIDHDVQAGDGDTGTPGVLGRKELDALLRAEVRRSDRYQVPFLLTVIELSAPPEWPELARFERFAEEFAAELRRRLREVDHLARLAERRFAVLNPHTDRSGGRVVVRAQEILKGLEERYPGASHVDVQGNQVLYPGDVPTLEDLRQRLQI